MNASSPADMTAYGNTSRCASSARNASRPAVSSAASAGSEKRSMPDRINAENTSGTTMPAPLLNRPMMEMRMAALSRGPMQTM